MYIGIAGQSSGTSACARPRSRSKQPGQRREHAAAAEEGPDAGEAGHLHREAPPHPALGEHPVEVERAPRLVEHGDVLGLQILPQVARRVAAASVVEHPVAVLEQALEQHVAAVGRARRDDQLAVLLAQHLGGRRVRRDHAQHEPRRLRAQPPQQRRQQQVALQVVGRDGQRHRQRRRIEPGGGGEAAHLVEQPPRAQCQRLGMRRRHDAAAALHEQWVADDRAQLVEQVAHRRLRHAEPLRGARHRLLLDHRQQQLQQPSVEVQMIELAHGSHQYRCVYLWLAALNTPCGAQPDRLPPRR